MTTSNNMFEIDEITALYEDSQVTYAVWAIGYNDNDEPTEAELLLASFDDPDTAIEFAEAVTLADIINSDDEDFIQETDYSVEYIRVEVETVVSTSEDSMNVGTIFHRTISFEENVVDVHVTADTYKLLDDGNIKIPCNIVGQVENNEIITVMFDDTPDKPVLTFKVLSSVNNFYICSFLCQYLGILAKKVRIPNLFFVYFVNLQIKQYML